MASIVFSDKKNRVSIIQTHGADFELLGQLAKAMEGKRIADITLRDHPDDVGGIQSPRKVLEFNLA